MVDYYLAIDLGASTGRHIVGWQENGTLKTQEVHRFHDYLVNTADSLVWDIDFILQELIVGIKKALLLFPNIYSLAIDSWGVDYVLVKNGHEVLPVYAYRNERTKNIIDAVHEKISFPELFETTGTQFQVFNTVYQLYDDLRKNRLGEDVTFLHIPEYLNYKLTGIMKHEITNASTTGLLNANSLNYDQTIIERLRFPQNLFRKLYEPGTYIGNLTKKIKEMVNGDVRVLLCATHDTASAVEGIEIPHESVYISSGTWSLVGIKTNIPFVDDLTMRLNFTNERGPNYYRLQKNIMGLWILQQLSKELDVTITEIITKARETKKFQLFNVNDERLFAPANMKSAVSELLIKNNQKISNAELFNSTFHSLAKSYSDAITEIEMITQEKISKIYITGGGAKNDYLNELTQKYTNKEVIALPYEATARGNLKIQMEAHDAQRSG